MYCFFYEVNYIEKPFIYLIIYVFIIFKRTLSPAALLWPLADTASPFCSLQPVTPVTSARLHVLVKCLSPKSKQPALTLIDFI